MVRALRSIPIVHRYIIAEILVPLFLCIFVFTGVLFLARSLKLVDLVINKNVPVGDIFKLFSYIIPGFLELAVPMSLLLAVILSFGRLSADSELVVMRSVGLSLKQLAVPVFVVSIFAMLTTAVLGFWVRPWANYRLGQGLFEIAKTQTGAGLVKGTFNDFGQLTIYAEEVQNKGERLNNVIIGDDRDPDVQRTFIAQHGKIVSNNKLRTLTLQLFDGSIQEGRGLNFDITNFEINSVRLPHSELVGERPSKDGKRSKEMYIGELLNTVSQLPEITEEHTKKEIRRIIGYQVELHKRLALPAGCVAVALIALALGIQPSRGGHTWGAAINICIGIVTILIYYLFFAVGNALAENRLAPPWVLLWTPNLVFLGLGLYLFKRMGSEQWLAVSQALGDILVRVARKFSNTG